jgi:hypothetical protein
MPPPPLNDGRGNAPTFVDAIFANMSQLTSPTMMMTMAILTVLTLRLRGGGNDAMQMLYYELEKSKLLP